eukprot:scaffold2927_cov408-Prasinococcus_capsulatus_cf.AAC.22
MAGTSCTRIVCSTCATYKLGVHRLRLGTTGCARSNATHIDGRAVATMVAPSLTSVASPALLVLLASLCNGSTRPDRGGDGAHLRYHRHILAEDEVPLSMNPMFSNWSRKEEPHFLTDMPTWLEEQHERHPLDSPELRGPFEYSEEELQVLERSLGVDVSEWNAKGGGIGGRPRPRYCVLDEAWRERVHPGLDFSKAGLRRALRAALRQDDIRNFLVNDRHQAPRGHDVLTGQPLRAELASSRSCPTLRTYSEA